MKKIPIMLAAILTLCGTMSALAQIDPQVTGIMRKCEKVMSNQMQSL